MIHGFVGMHNESLNIDMIRLVHLAVWKNALFKRITQPVLHIAHNVLYNIVYAGIQQYSGYNL